MERSVFLFALVLAGLTGGCFRADYDCHDECGSGTTGDGSGTATGMDTTGDTSADTSSGQTGEGSGTTDDSTTTGMDTTGDNSTDTGMTMDMGTMDDVGDTGSGDPCATNNECQAFEVCSKGLGECIPADSAVYEVVVSDVLIWGGPECAGDPDEYQQPCMQEIYTKALVDDVPEDQSQVINGVDYLAVKSYSFLVDIGGTLTFEIWDSDANEANMMDDLLLRKTFNTPAAVLHTGWLNDQWMEGNVSKMLSLQVIAQ